MIRVIITFLLAISCAFANVSAQEKIPDEITISYSAKSQFLKTVLLEISDKSGINIAFQDEILPVDSLINVEARNKPIGLIIDEILERTGTKYKIVGNQIVIIVDEFSQSKDMITISGYLTDSQSGESLISTNVFLYDKSAGTVTNEYGFYSLTVPKGTQRIYYSYLGYDIDIKEISLAKDTTISVEMKPSALLNEVLIIENTSVKLDESPASIVEIPLDRLNSIVSVAGESDIIRVVQNQAGVNSGADGFGGLSVRGGSVDQNLFLLDGVPIYNPSHALGIFSVFNSNVIKSATLYKSGFPARYGSRMSSVLDIWMREGSKEKIGGEFTLGLLAAKGTIEGPIIKDKASFLFSYRRTFWDIWQELGSEQIFRLNGGEGTFKYHFSDLNGKINFKLGKKSSIYLSYYQGDDVYESSSSLPTTGSSSTFIDKNETNWDWGNQMAVVRFSHQISKKAFLKSAVYLTNYKFNTYEFNRTEERVDSNIIATDFLAGLYTSDIQDRGFNLDFDILPNSKNTLRFGTNVILHKFRPGLLATSHLDNLFESAADISQDSLSAVLNNPEIDGTEIQIYFEDNIRPNKHHTINIGFHQSIIQNDGKTFFLPQPRLAYLYNKNKFTFKTSLSFVSQYIHLITNSGLGLPVDVWLPSTRTLEPQKGWLASAGFSFQGEKGFQFGSEVFYKEMRDLLSFAEGEIRNINEGNEWEASVPVGTGTAYGVETFFNKNIGRTTWSMNYTYSFAWRQFDKLNGGERFRFRYDRRHNFKFSFLHKINTNAEFNLNWSFATGNVVTWPTGVKEIRDDQGGMFEVLIYDEKNNLQIEDYHRLDIGFNFYSTYKKGRMKLSLGIFNIYNRLNPFYLDVKKVDSDPNQFAPFKYSLLPVLPSLTISYIF